MNQKTLAIAVIVIVVVAVVVAGVYLVMSGGGGGGGPTPTPTATPSGVAGASSLQYSVEITGGESAGTYTFKAKNIGESSMKIRIDISSGGVELSYVVNGAQQKSWMYMNGAWTESTFATDWDDWSSTITNYKGRLANWSGTGDYTYTDGAATVRIYDISVNPTLADSLFEPS